MRVEMRRFLRLCLLFGLSLSGGACSERALLQVKLSPDSTFQGSGYPEIQVTNELNDTSLRSIDQGTTGIAQIFLDESHKLQVGIYLPPNFEGTVKVHASVVDQDGCTIGDSTPATKDVHPGQTSYVDVPVTRSSTPCPPMMMVRPDGGATDAGEDRTGNDVAQDHPVDAAEEHPSDGGTDAGVDLAMAADAGEEHATGTDASDDGEEHVCDDAAPATPDLRGVPNCADYCEYVTANCTGTNAQYASEDDCNSICSASGWPAGLEMTGNGNTIGCRQAYAKAALNITGMPAMLLCRGAGQNSPNCKSTDGGQD
jgi:hypothetical protein